MADDQNLDNNIRRAEELKNIFTDIGSATARMNRALRAAGETASDYGGTYRSIRTSADKVATIQKESLKTAKGINKVTAEREKVESRISQLNAQINDFYERATRANGANRDLLLQQAKNLTNARDSAQEVRDVFKDIEKTASQLNSKTRFFDTLSDTVKLIPGLGPLISKPFEKAAEAARLAALEGKGLLNTFLQGLKTLGTEIGSVFTAGGIAKSILEASKQAKELSNSLGVGLTAANGIQREFTQFADQTGDARLTTQGLVNAQIKLQQNLKLGTQFSGETLQNFIQLTEYLGVSEKAASRIALVQESIGDKSGEFANNLAESAVLSARNLGVNLPLQEVYESIGNLSTTTLINLRRNPEALGQALAEAKKLGIELDNIRGISESLLNFEQSIQAELEAEVLTGRQLNLERARAAALRGDDVALAQELSKQVGTISEFENMNVIARQSLAKSFGLNVDQMGDMLLRQEAIKLNEEAAAKLSDKQLQAARARVDETTTLGQALKEVATEADITKNFENSAKQLQQAFQQFILPLIDPITKFTKVLADLMAGPLGKITALGGAGVAIALKAMSLIRGTDALPMVVRMQGTGSSMASSLLKGGKFSAKGFGIGAIGGLAGAALMQSDNPTVSGAGTVLSAAGTGASIGSIIPGIGTAVGAAVGGGIGLIIEFLKDDREERKQAEQKRQEEFQSTMREVAMKEARIYMDKHEVGRSTANATAL